MRLAGASKARRMARRMARRDLCGTSVVTFSAKSLAKSLKLCTFAAWDALGGSVVSGLGLVSRRSNTLFIYYYGNNP